MLRKLFVDGDRGLVNFSWDAVPPLSLLEGRNGAGKSSLFEALGKVRSLVCKGETATRVFPGAHLSIGTGRALQTYALEVDIGGELLSYRLQIDHHVKGGNPFVQREVLEKVQGGRLFECTEGHAQLFHDDGSAGPSLSVDRARSALSPIPEGPSNTKLTAFKNWLARAWHIQPNPFGMSSDSQKEADEPDPRLANFVSWYRAASGDSEKVARLNQELRGVLDGFVSLNLDKAGRETKALFARFTLDDGKVAEFALEELSEGQRTLIALHALLEFAPEGATLLIDEPDNFLALTEIQPWLMKVEEATEKGRIQVIVASHHPEVINRLWAVHGFIIERSRLGPSTIRRPDPNEGIAPADAVKLGIE
ncbi:MAG: ATP-binding protein [Deltaproteobacteria bacterium]|nr:ATP-binding protein [Deltaproteobacteria bacterium]